MKKSTEQIEMPYQFNGECGELKAEIELEIEIGYFGTKFDEVKEWHSPELKSLTINEAYFVKDGSVIENKLSKAETNEVYKDVKIYIEENIENFI